MQLYLVRSHWFCFFLCAVLQKPYPQLRTFSPQSFVAPKWLFQSETWDRNVHIGPYIRLLLKLLAERLINTARKIPLWSWLVGGVLLACLLVFTILSLSLFSLCSSGCFRKGWERWYTLEFDPQIPDKATTQQFCSGAETVTADSKLNSIAYTFPPVKCKRKHCWQFSIFQKIFKLPRGLEGDWLHQARQENKTREEW